MSRSYEKKEPFFVIVEFKEECDRDYEVCFFREFIIKKEGNFVKLQARKFVRNEAGGVIGRESVYETIPCSEIIGIWDPDFEPKVYKSKDKSKRTKKTKGQINLF